MRRMLYMFLGSFLLFTSCKKEEQKLTIATAANMQFAMDSLVKNFELKTGIPCQTVIGSSGKLTAQITAGAPYDIFVAANMKYPNALFEKGLTANKPKIYAHGKLVLWTLDANIKPSIDILNSQEINHIALANPDTAPYGTAAMEVLSFYKLNETLKNKLVFGESIAQTNSFIHSQSAEIGFTSLSTIKAPKLVNKGAWIEIDTKFYKPIEQGIVLLKKHNKDAQQFYDFLFTEEARQILTHFGYE
ncbi:molybdate ABC transporter substrate-binding protein [Arcticibacterium luteifluviistationis]|uniref:Molybdate ABC transporter substrate-binding protein n=1 Tax=Arcticibacterium luteifluviistationis TaxID=1784714 RepID=A0A2Z4G7R1_9BACT|nr:molybdate ABC transporter substrate-binding protein [Arcticibacterium luteifluviistationis]AWV97209.1 molybdate ABC transporter substrate-binding protein [Arcticibacterium luteifluviistationis]